jgi:PAS domain S-box-containing protein
MNLDYSPVYDEAGRPAGVIAVVVETTEQVRAEAELKAQRDRAQNVLDGMGDGFMLLSHDLTILEINDEGARVEGRPREAMIGRSHWEIWPDTWDMPLGETYRRAMSERTPFAIENRYVWEDREAWLDVRGYPVDEGLAVFFRDISEKKRAEEHLRLMINELNHRVKNSLATVQAIASQTLRRDEVPAPVREALTQRLKALAQAHDVLTGEKWSGASLKEIALLAAAPYGGVGFVIEGPRITLPPKTAIAMALAFHELATNAAKYGALSRPSGVIEIRWTVSDNRVRLTWRERGGPEVEPPRQSGYGMRLIERALAAEFDGEVKLAFEREGLACEIDANLPPTPAALPL